MDNISFRTMGVTEASDKQFVRDIKQRRLDDLSADGVLINVQYSSQL
jgi:hypothetical protein